MLFAEREGILPHQGGQISVTQQPTPLQACTLHARSLSLGPHLCDLCTSHDIKTIWTHVEQSRRLCGGHCIEFSLC